MNITPELRKIADDVKSGAMTMEAAVPLLRAFGIEVECFKAIPSFPGYSISDRNRVLEDKDSAIVGESPQGFVTIKGPDGVYTVVEVSKLREETFAPQGESANGTA